MGPRQQAKDREERGQSEVNVHGDFRFGSNRAAKSQTTTKEIKNIFRSEKHAGSFLDNATTITLRSKL